MKLENNEDRKKRLLREKLEAAGFKKNKIKREIESQRLSRQQLQQLQLDPNVEGMASLLAWKFIFSNSIVVSRLKNAFEILVKKYPILNSIYVKKSDFFYPEVLQHLDWLEIESGLNWVDTIKPIDIKKSAPLKILLKKFDDHIELVIVLHHIAADEISWQILLSELESIYFKLGNNESISFLSHSDVQPNIESNLIVNSNKYWIENLKPYFQLERVDLFSIYRNKLNNKNKYISDTVTQKITIDQLKKLKSVAKELKVSLTPILMASVFLLLTRRGLKNTIIGTAIDQRESEESFKTIGNFITLLPIIFQHDDHTSLYALIRKVHHIIIKSHRYRFLCIEDLIHELKIVNMGIRHPLFDFIVLHRNINREIKLEDEIVRGQHISSKHSLFDVVFSMDEADLTLSCEYHSELLPKKLVEALLHDWYELLIQLESESIELNKQNRQLSYDDLFTTKQQDIMERIQELVMYDPHKIAVNYLESGVTRQELWDRVKILAKILNNKGVVVGDTVVIAIERSINIPIAFLACLYVGAIFVPLDITQPLKRLTKFVDKSRPKIIISNSELMCQKITKNLGNIKNLILDKNTLQKIYHCSLENKPKAIINHNIPAYVIFTSGTTGEPKGVIISRMGLNSVLNGMKDKFILEDSSRYLALSTLGFDIAIFEILAPLYYGINLVIGKSEWSRDPVELSHQINVIKPSIIEATPSLWSEIIKTESCNLEGIHVCCGGETLSLKVSNHLIKGKAKVSNLYGPTETTIISTYLTCKEDKVPTLGYSLDTVGFVILNYQLEIIPDGFLGELYLFGPQIAHGYLQLASETSEKFVANPFISGERMYRTGDLAFIDVSSGEICYCGRSDAQLSLHGVRVEAQEIEQTIEQISGVSAAVVKTEEIGNQSVLYAYYIGSIDENKVRWELKQVLPYYLQPVSITKIDKIPLSFNGKIDRKKLPKPMLDDNIVRPISTDEEKIVANGFEKVLGIKNIHATSNFFQLGGYSLQIAALLSYFEHITGVRLLAKDIFDHPTIEEIALLLTKRRNKDSGNSLLNEDNNLLTNFDSQQFNLTMGQKRILSAEKISEFPGLYNMPLVLKISGLPDVDLLKKVFLKILEKHRILTSVYDISLLTARILKWECVIEQWDSSFRIIDYTHHDHLYKLINEEINRPFNLEDELPIRCFYYRSQEENIEDYLLIVIHHIVADEWSVRVLFNEIIELYNKLLKCPSIPISVTGNVRYFELLNNLDHFSNNSKEYWQNKMEGVQLTELPFLTFSQNMESSRLEKVLHQQIILNDQEIAQVEEYETQYKISPFHWFQTCLINVLARFSQQDVCIGIPVHGRDHRDYIDVVGYFSNTLPIRIQCDLDWEVQTLLSNVRDTVLEAMSYADVPLEKIFLDSSKIPFSILVDYRKGQLPCLVTDNFVAQAINWDIRLPKFPVIILYTIEGVTHKIDLLLSDKYYNEQSAVLFKNALAKSIDFILNDPTKKISELNYFNINQNNINFKYEQYFKTSSQPFKFLPEIIYQSLIDYKNRIAISGMGYELDYKNLLIVLSVISKLLIEKLGKNGKEEIIIIYANNRFEQIILMLSVLFIGRTYVVLDPDHPKDRLIQLIDKLKPSLFLTTQQYSEKIDWNNFQLCIVDFNNLLNFNGDQTSKCFINPPHPNYLAYIVFTSGSTGEPKGVSISYAGLSDLVYWFRNIFYLDKPIRLLSLASMTFDVGLIEVLSSLVTGGHIKVVEDHERAGEDLLRAAKAHSITNLAVTPTILDTLGNPKNIDKDVVISVGAEAVSSKSFREWSKEHTIVNLYGPSEASVNALTYIEKQYFMGDQVPIGLPDYGMSAVILDSALQPVPVGVKGELYLGGTGLARGYWNNPTATAMRFIASPFKELGYRIYRTGDLASIDANGLIVLHGRVDNQFKIRGLRIEPREIERAFLSFKEISSVWVGVEDSVERPSLIAAITVDNNCSIQDVSLEFRVRLKDKLPQYLIPQTIILLPSLPITSNGKVNKKEIINQFYQIKSKSNSNSNLLAPEFKYPNNILMLLQESVSKVLSLDIAQLDVSKNFLELGGDSIGALQVIGYLKKNNIPLTPKELFEAESLVNLAMMLKIEDNSALGNLVYKTKNLKSQEDVGSFLPTIIIQEYLQQNKSDQLFAYSILLDAPRDIDEKIVVLLEKLIARHSSLRTRYISSELAITLPSNHPNVMPEVIVLEGDDLSFDVIKNNLGKFLNPYLGKNIVVGVINHVKNAEKNIVLIIHHLAADMVSVRTILKELRLLYQEKELLPVLYSLKEYAKIFGSQKIQFLSSEIPKHRAKIISKKLDPKLDTAFKSKMITISINHILTANLVETLNRLRNNFYDVNLNIEHILICLVAKSIGHMDKFGPGITSIDLESHGRDQLDYLETVGWFTTIRSLVIPTKLDLKEQITYIHTQLGDNNNAFSIAHDHQDRSEISFNYLGELDLGLDGNKNQQLFNTVKGEEALSILYSDELPLRNPISITAQLVKNQNQQQLRLNFIWSPRLVSNNKLKQFINLIENEIDSLKRNCHLLVEQKYLPLTYTQEGLFQIQETGIESNNAYIIKIRLFFEGDLNSEQLKYAWCQVLLKHEMLRASFHREDEEYFAKLDGVKLDWLYEQYVSDDVHGSFLEFIEHTESKLNRNFNINSAPLFRVCMISKNKKEHVIILLMHHILADGWSSPIILRDLFDAYKGELIVKTSSIATVINSIKSQPKKEALYKWKKYLRGIHSTILVQSGEDKGYRRELKWNIGKENLLRLQVLSKENKITFGSLLHVIWAKCLMKLTDKKSVSFGSVTAGRPSFIKDIENVVGLFSNTVPIHITEANGSLLESARKVGEILLMSSDVPIPLSELLSLSGQDQLFDSLLVIENYPIDFNMLSNPLPGVKLSKYEYEDGTHYPVSIIFNVGSDSIQVRLLMANEVDFGFSIEFVRNTFNDCVNEIINNKGKFTKKILSKDNHLVDRIRGIQLTGQSLKNRQLITISSAVCDSHLNNLTRRLIQFGCRPETKVVISLPRSIEAVLLAISVWKTGACLVPLDCEIENLRYLQIIDRLKPEIIIDIHSIERLGLMIDLDEIDDKTGNEKPFTPSERLSSVSLANTAYIIHTSGTTGVAKAISMPWSVMENLINWQKEEISINQQQVIAHFAPSYFDVSIQELLTAFVFQTSMVIVPEDLRKNISDLSYYLEQNRVDILFATNLVINELASVYIHKKIPNLEHIIQAGEKLEVSSALAQWISNDDGPKLHNHYGPAETHVVMADSTFSSEKKVASIGKPITNTDLLILDEQLKEVSLGRIGEIYLVGKNLSNGYINDPVQTAIRFVAIPREINIGFKATRMYRSGDLGYKSSDGNYYCLGRADDQIKIKGIRVEPGEVISALSNIKGVVAASVISNQEKNATGLLAAVVIDSDSLLTEIDIEKQLSQVLPDYLLPNIIKIVDIIPKTKNNKVDIQCLRKTILDRITVSSNISVSSYNFKLDIIKSIMTSVLCSEQTIRDTDDFLSVGGHSLLATKLVTRINQTFDSNLIISDIFELRTPLNILKKLDEKPNYSLSRVKWNRTNRIVASSAQTRFWALSQVVNTGSTYHLPLTVKIKDEKTQYNSQLLFNLFKKTVLQIIHRHESLRTVIKTDEDGPYQLVLSKNQLESRLMAVHKKIKQKFLPHQINLFHSKSFDLTNDLMLRFGLFTLENKTTVSGQEHVLLITIHHISCDAWSIANILKDFNIIFNNLLKDKDYYIEETESNYINEIGRRELYWTKNNMSDRDLNYWKNQLRDLPCPMNLPCDFQRPSEPRFKGDLLEFNFGLNIGRKVVSFAQKNNLTPFMFIQTSIALLLHRLGCGRDIVLGTPDSGRQDIIDQEIVGCFINLIVLKFNLSGNPTFLELTRRVRRTVMDAYSHYTTSFEQLVKEFSSSGVKTSHPLFTVGVGLQNPSDFTFNLSGLNIEAINYKPKVARYDLNFDVIISNSNPELKFLVEYDTGLFTKKSIEKMMLRLEMIIELALYFPQQHLSDFSILLPSERLNFYQKISKDFTIGEIDLNCQRIVHGFLPQGVDYSKLISDSTQSLSYESFDDQVNLIAKKLLLKGVRQGDFICISCSRSINFYVAVLAVLRIGGTYVPLSLETPEDRVSNIIQQANIKLIITDTKRKLSNIKINSLILGLESDLQNEVNINIELPDIQSLSLELGAYIIFTSGTTGEPKGILVNRKHLALALDGMNLSIPKKSLDCYFSFSAFNFDLGVFDVLWPICNNLEIYITDENQRLNPSLIKPIMQSKKSMISLSTPSFWSILSSVVKSEDPKDFFAGFKILSAGELLAEPLAQKLKQQGAEVWPSYGPAETIIISSIYHYRNGIPSLGNDFKYVKTFVLDEYLNPVPDNVSGEIYIAGYQLACGYIANPELTSTKFIANPFFTGVMYRSGDIGVWKNQQLYFQGRSDTQISIRGHRIEIGEVVSVLLELSEVKEVVIKLCTQGTSSFLVAYIVLEQGFSEECFPQIRKDITRKLPEYMVPHILIRIDQIPLTLNGKIDYRKLPNPQNFQIGEKVKTKTEKDIAQLIMDLLGIPEPSRNAGFISLGLDSISIILLSNRLKDMGYDCTPQMIFENQNIYTLGQMIDDLKSTQKNTLKYHSDHVEVNVIEELRKNNSLQSVLNKWKNKKNRE
ncbi:MAG: D-alanine--poly(phosphoribitol) ligase subunit DltA [Neisseriaceae bacterium]|nr:MAG: D-alanine--poly(phosphoribitol) ligase subunit DltA [Neisseriaceae bacterium]